MKTLDSYLHINIHVIPIEDKLFSCVVIWGKFE